MVQTVLNIIKLNPEVNNSPDIPMNETEQTEASKKQVPDKTGIPGTAAADKARKKE